MLSMMFFFFKQKTAYEMRISDWSSDVCSSDLPGRTARIPERAGDSSGSYRDHRAHDGLRHDRHRARSRAGQEQEVGRRGVDADREPDRPPGLDRKSVV